METPAEVKVMHSERYIKTLRLTSEQLVSIHSTADMYIFTHIMLLYTGVWYGCRRS